jgi:hypothetical protein
MPITSLGSGDENVAESLKGGKHMNIFWSYNVNYLFPLTLARGRRGRDRKVVGFTTTYAISAYHH